MTPATRSPERPSHKSRPADARPPARSTTAPRCRSRTVTGGDGPSRARAARNPSRLRKISWPAAEMNTAPASGSTLSTIMAELLSCPLARAPEIPIIGSERAEEEETEPSKTT